MAANPNNIVSLNTASTNVTTGAYVTLAAATPISTAKILAFNGTSSIIKIAVGAAGNEVDLIALLPTSQVVIELGSINVIPVGSRLSVEALDATASSKYVGVALLP